jgi:sarcosine oxidase subunit alpha
MVGTLVYASPDESNPLKAIGTVVRIMQGFAIALVAGTTGQSVCVREPGRAITIRLVAPYREGMDLAAALGGGTSAF